ncbi:MAG: TRAM domain-containing protein, partial [Thermoplasmata archaeon]|nr:TRAM domain-containing protein [Thermoplasmata archaeon]
MRVLVTKKGRPGSVICRDDNYRTVVITKDLPVGEWHRVRIV